jgi:hypothetical protein
MVEASYNNFGYNKYFRGLVGFIKYEFDSLYLSNNAKISNAGLDYYQLSLSFKEILP